MWPTGCPNSFVDSDRVYKTQGPANHRAPKGMGLQTILLYRARERKNDTCAPAGALQGCCHAGADCPGDVVSGFWSENPFLGRDTPFSCAGILLGTRGYQRE